MGKKKTIEGEEPEASKRPRTRRNKDPDLIGVALSHDSIERNATMESNEEREESLEVDSSEEGQRSGSRLHESSQKGGSQDTDVGFSVENP